MNGIININRNTIIGDGIRTNSYSTETHYITIQGTVNIASNSTTGNGYMIYANDKLTLAGSSVNIYENNLSGGLIWCRFSLNFNAPMNIKDNKFNTNDQVNQIIYQTGNSSYYLNINQNINLQNNEITSKAAFIYAVFNINIATNRTVNISNNKTISNSKTNRTGAMIYCASNINMNGTSNLTIENNTYEILSDPTSSAMNLVSAIMLSGTGSVLNVGSGKLFIKNNKTINENKKLPATHYYGFRSHYTGTGGAISQYSSTKFNKDNYIDSASINGGFGRLYASWNSTYVDDYSDDGWQNMIKADSAYEGNRLYRSSAVLMMTNEMPHIHKTCGQATWSECDHPGIESHTKSVEYQPLRSGSFPSSGNWYLPANFSPSVTLVAVTGDLNLCLNGNSLYNVRFNQGNTSAKVTITTCRGGYSYMYSGVNTTGGDRMFTNVGAGLDLLAPKGSTLGFSTDIFFYNDRNNAVVNMYNVYTFHYTGNPKYTSIAGFAGTNSKYNLVNFSMGNFELYDNSSYADRCAMQFYPNTTVNIDGLSLYSISAPRQHLMVFSNGSKVNFKATEKDIQIYSNTVGTQSASHLVFLGTAAKVNFDLGSKKLRIFSNVLTNNSSCLINTTANTAENEIHIKGDVEINNNTCGFLMYLLGGTFTFSGSTQIYSNSLSYYGIYVSGSAGSSKLSFSGKTNIYSKFIFYSELLQIL